MNRFYGGSNNKRNVVSSMRVPGVPAIFAPSMAAYLGPTQGRIFHDITEATNEMVKRTLTRFSTHAWKSLASTSGGNFETFSVAVMNPYLPMDLNNAGVMLGLGVNPTQPISKKNPPDSKTQAFMLIGGDYYTVNMKIPLKIQEEWPDAKGADAQADYVRVIPPTNPRGNYKVKIIEFKNGLTHLEMADEEAAQMMKETAAITEWYKSLGKNVEIERFYCPAAATNARAYGSTHISPYVHFITVSGLSRIIQIPLAQMKNFTRYRTTYTQALTHKLAEIEKRTLQFLEETDKALVLNRLRQITPKNLGLNNNNANLASGRNYPQRRLTVVKYMIIRSTLMRKLKGNVSEEEKKQLSRKLRHVTQLVLEANKPFNVSEQVLTNNARRNLIAALGGKASKAPQIPDTSFEDLVFERREYLKETYPNLPEWPSNFDASELIKPITFSSNEEAINSRLATLSRKKAITHANIDVVIRTTQGRVANRLSNHFKMYFQSKINKFRAIANTNKVQVNTSKKRSISNLVYNSNSNNENNEVMSKARKAELPTNVLNSIINSENFEAQYRAFLTAHGANAGRAINNRIIQLRNLNKNKAYTTYYNGINAAKKRVNSTI
jgi:hypothetical protein